MSIGDIGSFIQKLVPGAVRSGTSIFYAALGEVIVERAGIVNLGLEGCMLMGACFGFVATVLSGSAYLGLLAAAIAGALFNLLLGFLVITRRASQLASGLVLYFLALGLTSLVGADYVGQRIHGFDQFSIPLLAQIPLIGPALFQGDILTFAIIPCFLLVWWVLYRTRWGLWLRTVGESRRVAYATGLSPHWIQYQALAIGGMLGGIGGAQLSLSYARAWVENMTNGYGFIAVAIVIFASWRPLGVIWGALLFGGAVAFQIELQAGNVSVSPFLLNMIPYILTLLVLLVAGRRRRYQMPEGLKEVFEGTGS